MKRIVIRILMYIMISVFLLFAILYLGLAFFYKDNNKPNDMNFSNYEIEERIKVSSTEYMLDDMEKFTIGYVAPLYLQWISINVFVENNSVTDELMECAYNTFDKKTNQYGEIHTLINTKSGKIMKLSGEYGFDPKDIPLVENANKKQWSQQIELYLARALNKMGDINKMKSNYNFELIFIKDKIMIYNEDKEYTYNVELEQYIE